MLNTFICVLLFDFAEASAGDAAVAARDFRMKMAH
jgi:hypothetical protein